MPQTKKQSSNANVDEAYYLFSAAALGLVLNAAVLACLLAKRQLRRMTSAFVMHNCLLDLIKSAYCVPFAHSLLKDVAPSFCTALGGSYVVIVTASGFNMVAMICCEAYTFGDKQREGFGREATGSLCCVVFGIVMVYIGSIIIHLGPTIIGGNFNYNKLIGNCIFVYGPIKSYVVHAMWIAIMTLAMIAAVYYLLFFYRHLHASAICDTRQSRDTVQESLSRARVLITITALFIFCWYPLFILTLVDPTFNQPTRIYKLLTFVAWSHSSLNPVIFLLFDRRIDSCRKMCCSCGCRQVPSPMQVPPSLRLAPPTVQVTQMYQRVGCRLCQQGRTHSERMCNGSMQKTNSDNLPSVVRDRSFCQLHDL
ncbi:unnamed protein product [Dimorphilus gyrociliatus]|nr:unnamed protein product [Dimorphilus gyrociliatus]